MSWLMFGTGPDVLVVPAACELIKIHTGILIMSTNFKLISNSLRLLTTCANSPVQLC